MMEWNRWRYRTDGEMKVTDCDAYLSRHMKLYDDGQKHRLRLRARWTAEDIAELERDDPEEEAYQTGIRDMHSEFREFAPLINRVSGELNRCIFEASDALGDAPGSVQSEDTLRGTMKKFVNHCRKLVGLLWCAGAGSVEAHQPVATQGHIALSSHAPSSSRLVEEEEEEEEEKATHEEREEEDESNGEEDYDEDCGPPTTQHLKHLSCRRGIRRRRIC